MAVIPVVPAAIAVTTPFLSTIATSSSPLLNVIFRLVALVGVTHAASFLLSPSTNFIVTWSIPIPLTAIVISTTVSTKDVSAFPSAVATVIVVVPAASALISPFSSTVATVGSLLLQTYSGVSAVSGITVTSTFMVMPVVIVAATFSTRI